MNWTHPTGKSPKTVALVCLGPSRTVYADACLAPDLSDAVLGVDEVWTLNRGASLFRHDLLFLMDHIQGEADKFPRYGAMLWRHDRPIITSDNCDGWPDHVRKYPFNAIWDWLRRGIAPNHGDWFHNSVAYILVYAAYIGVKELRVFGADYTHHSSGAVEDGHPCVAYWAGKLEAAGLLVRAAADSAFLGTNQRGWIYGYQHDPRRIPANRSRFRALVGLSADPDSVALLSGERQVAESLEQIQPDHRHRYAWAAGKVSGKVLDCGGGIGYGASILADHCDEVLMVERSAESVEYAQAHYAQPNIRYAVADLRDPILLTSPPADWATAFEIIEHLADPLPFLTNLPARRLLASVPNETVIPYSPETAPFHHRHYTRDQFNALLTQAGWRVVGWHCQRDPLSPVLPWAEGGRTLVVEAERG